MLDPVRAKMVAATPEEEVRQALVSWLHAEKGVPYHLMETECALGHFRKGVSGRVDLLVHGFRSGQNAVRPWLLAECKRSGETDWQRLQVQVNRYIQWLCPEYLLLQIGDLRHLYRMEAAEGTALRAIPCDDLPSFPQRTSDESGNP